MLNLYVVKGNPRRKKDRSLVTTRIVLPTVVLNLLLGEAVSEDEPETETGGGTTLSPTVAAVPGDLETKVDQDESVFATQTMEITPVSASAIVVRNPLPVADAVVGATFNPPYLVPHPDHVLIGDLVRHPSTRHYTLRYG